MRLNGRCKRCCGITPLIRLQPRSNPIPVCPPPPHLEIPKTALLFAVLIPTDFSRCLTHAPAPCVPFPRPRVCTFRRRPSWTPSNAWPQYFYPGRLISQYPTPAPYIFPPPPFISASRRRPSWTPSSARRRYSPTRLQPVTNSRPCLVCPPPPFILTSRRRPSWTPSSAWRPTTWPSSRCAASRWSGCSRGTPSRRRSESLWNVFSLISTYERAPPSSGLGLPGSALCVRTASWACPFMFFIPISYRIAGFM